MLYEVITGRHSRFDRMEIGEEEMGEVVIPENFNFDGL